MTKKIKSVAKAKGPSTNKTKSSLVKTIVLEDIGKWTRPKSGEKFYIDEDTIFPNVEFEIETDELPPYKLTWSISWPAAVSGLKESSARGKVLKTFTLSGELSISSKLWKATFPSVVGGTLTVKVCTPSETFKRSVYILGKNPDQARVETFLKTIDDVKGFEKLLEQESKFKNFINADGYPIVAFDGGYGMTQMTSPAPTFTQIWNWKENIKGGTALYKTKQAEAKQHLSSHKRSYTDEQLKLETWSRWNGGPYHVWNEAAKAWTRDPDILADSKTGNIGWNIKNIENKDKTESELHERDKDEYKKPPPKEKRLWTYSGVVYADHVNH